MAVIIYSIKKVDIYANKKARSTRAFLFAGKFDCYIKKITHPPCDEKKNVIKYVCFFARKRIRTWCPGPWV